MNKIIPLTIATSFFLITLLGCGSPEKETEPKPEVKANSADITNQKLVADHTYVEISPADLSALKRGDEMRISGDAPEMDFTLNIRRVSENMPGITSISAFVNNSETDQATLILREGNISGQIQLFEKDILYRVAYDSTQSAHYLQEINKDSLDTMEGGQPLVPQQKPVEY